MPPPEQYSMRMKTSCVPFGRRWCDESRYVMRYGDWGSAFWGESASLHEHKLQLNSKLLTITSISLLTSAHTLSSSKAIRFRQCSVYPFSPHRWVLLLLVPLFLGG